MSADSRRRGGRSHPIVAVLLLGFGVLAASPAAAQQREHRSFLDFLFGRHRDEQPQRVAPPRRAKPVRRRSTQPAVRHAPPPEPTVEKSADAREVLILGDFVASGLADGLKEAFADAPGVVVADQTNGSSGLVRDDYYDWPAKAGPILDAEKPAIVVVMLGANDRQAIKVDGTGEPVRSDAWTAAYSARVEALAKTVTSRHVPLLWVGMPAFQYSSMSEDILAFDGIYRDVATKAGGEFVDTWDGFVDENGQFVFTGSDVNGQQVRLRGSDGINFTAAGKRKLAFYVEKPLRRLLGEAAGSVAAPIDLPSDQPASPVQGPELPKAITRTPPIGLKDPGLDGDTALLGGSPLASTPDTPRTLLVNEGRMAQPPAGRTDDFRWNSQAAKTAAKPEESLSGPHRVILSDPMRVDTPRAP